MLLGEGRWGGGGPPWCWGCVFWSPLAFLRRLLLWALVAGVAAHGCVHEQTWRTTGGVRNTGYYFNKNVPYSGGGEGRRKLQSSSSFAPIRIQVDYSANALSALTTEQQDYLQNTLLPEALDWVQASLQVVPVSGMLRYARWCASRFSSGTCFQEGASTCEPVEIIDAHNFPKDS